MKNDKDDSHNEGNPHQIQNSDKGEDGSPKQTQKSEENSDQGSKASDDGGSSIKDQVEQVIVIKPLLSSPQSSQEHVLAT